MSFIFPSIIQNTIDSIQQQATQAAGAATQIIGSATQTAAGVGAAIGAQATIQPLTPMVAAQAIAQNIMPAPPQPTVQPRPQEPTTVYTQIGQRGNDWGNETIIRPNDMVYPGSGTNRTLPENLPFTSIRNPRSGNDVISIEGVRQGSILYDPVQKKFYSPSLSEAKPASEVVVPLGFKYNNDTRMSPEVSALINQSSYQSNSGRSGWNLFSDPSSLFYSPALGRGDWSNVKNPVSSAKNIFDSYLSWRLNDAQDIKQAKDYEELKQELADNPDLSYKERIQLIGNSKWANEESMSVGLGLGGSGGLNGIRGITAGEWVSKVPIANDIVRAVSLNLENAGVTGAGKSQGVIRSELAARLNTIGMDEGQKNVYLNSVWAERNLRGIEPGVQSSPILGNAQHVTSNADSITEVLSSEPHSLYGGITMESQFSTRLPRPTKDIDVMVMNPQSTAQKIVDKINNPGITVENGLVQSPMGHLVDAHAAPLDYPLSTGVKGIGLVTAYDESEKETMKVGTKLFGEPIQAAIPRPNQVFTINGLQQERLDFSGTRKLSAVITDIANPEAKGYRFEKDLYDAVNIGKELINVERSRLESKDILSKTIGNYKLNRAESNLDQILGSTINYKTQSGESVTKTGREIFEAMDAEIQQSPAISLFKPEIKSEAKEETSKIIVSPIKSKYNSLFDDASSTIKPYALVSTTKFNITKNPLQLSILPSVTSGKSSRISASASPERSSPVLASPSLERSSPVLASPSLERSSPISASASPERSSPISASASPEISSPIPPTGSITPPPIPPYSSVFYLNDENQRAKKYFIPSIMPFGGNSSRGYNGRPSKKLWVNPDFLASVGVPVKAAGLGGGGLTPGRHSKPAGKPPNGLRKKHLRTLKDHTRVYSVDGNFIRNKMETDFIGGGHSLAYKSLIPSGEIWIEKMRSNQDQKAILKHEESEYHHMRYNHWNYQKAHREANNVESKYRERQARKHIDKLLGKKKR